jgi:hypothetical protein
MPFIDYSIQEIAMKNLIAIIAMLSITSSAQAIHVYADYNCKKGPIDLKYNGPGSNYAVGGYSNFYMNGEEKGILAYEKLGSDDKEEVGSVVGDHGSLEVTFESTNIKNITEPVGVKPVPCEDMDYEHSEWKTIRTIKISAISKMASQKLGLNAGDQIDMDCDETMDVPVSCE